MDAVKTTRVETVRSVRSSAIAVNLDSTVPAQMSTTLDLYANAKLIVALTTSGTTRRQNQVHDSRCDLVRT